jgi:hypothetical protein
VKGILDSFIRPPRRFFWPLDCGWALAFRLFWGLWDGMGLEFV